MNKFPVKLRLPKEVRLRFYLSRTYPDPTGYIQQSAFADGCYELTPAYSAFQRAFGLQNFLLNAGRNNTMLAMNPLVAIGLLDKSTSGGSWSRSTGMSYYKSDAEGFDAGCEYNDYFNSWGETEAKSKANARGAFANNMTVEQYLKYMSLTCSIEGGIRTLGVGDWIFIGKGKPNIFVDAEVGNNPDYYYGGYYSIHLKVYGGDYSDYNWVQTFSYNNDPIRPESDFGLYYSNGDKSYLKPFYGADANMFFFDEPNANKSFSAELTLIGKRGNHWESIQSFSWGYSVNNGVTTAMPFTLIYSPSQIHSIYLNYSLFRLNP